MTEYTRRDLNLLIGAVSGLTDSHIASGYIDMLFNQRCVLEYFLFGNVHPNINYNSNKSSRKVYYSVVRQEAALSIIRLLPSSASDGSDDLSFFSHISRFTLLVRELYNVSRAPALIRILRLIESRHEQPPSVNQIAIMDAVNAFSNNIDKSKSRLSNLAQIVYKQISRGMEEAE